MTERARVRALIDREADFAAVLAAPYGPLAAGPAEVADALRNHPGPGRRLIVVLPDGYAAVRLPDNRHGRLDIDSAPKFATAIEAERWILRERWAARGGS